MVERRQKLGELSVGGREVVSWDYWGCWESKWQNNGLWSRRRCGSDTQNEGVKVNPAKGEERSTEISQWGTGKCCRRVIERFTAASPFLMKQLVIANKVWFGGLRKVEKTRWKLFQAQEMENGGCEATGWPTRVQKARMFMKLVSLRLRPLLPCSAIQSSGQGVNKKRLPILGLEFGNKRCLEKWDSIGV